MWMDLYPIYKVEIFFPQFCGFILEFNLCQNNKIKHMELINP